MTMGAGALGHPRGDEAVSVGRARRATDGAAGTGLLVRLILRRDRIRLPIWILVIAGMVSYFHAVLGLSVESMSRTEIVALSRSPMLRMFAGPGYGLEDFTLARYFLAAYAPEFLLAAALMSLLLIVRHTRAEEATGRGELVRAGVVGRHAALTATLLVALGANTVLALAVTLTAAGSVGLPIGSALLFGGGVGLTGLVFAGIAAVAVQLTEESRTAAGLAGAALGVLWLVRAIGDLLGEHGSLLSWFSPLAWPQQTRVLVDERIWPLVLSVLVVAGLVALAYALAARRDFGAGLLPARIGKASAPSWLSTPFTLAWRLRRGQLLRWAVPLGVAGLVYGSLAGPMGDQLSELPEGLFAGGAGASVLDVYFGLLVIGMSFVVGISLLLTVQRLRSAEDSGLVTLVLVTPTARAVWLGGQLAISAGTAVVLLLSAGLGTGLGAAIATGDGAMVGELTVNQLVRVPEVLVLVALATALYGWVPRLVGLGWLVLLYGVTMRWFAPLGDWPDWVTGLSPFQHIARMPQEPFSILPVLVLTALAVVLAALALAGFRRRDLAG